MENLKETNNLIADYYIQHYDELLAFVCRHSLSQETSEDIVQNVFLRILSIGKMITAITLPSLVYTVARNLIYDYWRHLRYVEEYEHYLAWQGCQSSPASVYSINEIGEILERGIARLSDKHQHIYRMSLYEGLQVSEISQTLNMNYKSVENRLGMARKEVRQYMRRMLVS
uniref:Sigma-70 family RNA polymerase sigma factor n=1 Tax=Prevotella sp. GTC17254 TaxID=3236794 RepID=A0AB33IVU4_9BACT